MKKPEEIRFTSNDARYRHQQRRERLYRFWQRVKDWLRSFFH